MTADLPDMEEPPHPGVGRALRLNAKAAGLQARADMVPGPDGFRLELRAELVRESRRIALAEVAESGDG